MKKLILAALMPAALLGLAQYADAADPSELRIYLNPGHGSWCSNDRPMDILREVNGELTVVHPGTSPNTQKSTPDTTAFYESNTNIRKMLAVVDKLESYGLKIDRTKNQDNPNKYRVGAALDLSNNIVMSHVMAGPYPHDPDIATICNRSLQEIREEVEVNNFDMFFSLHSNAALGSYTNYLSILYRGYSNINNAAGVELGANDSKTTPDLVPGSQQMAIACAEQALKMAHQHWTERKTAAVGSGAVLGDIDFYHGSSISENNGKYYRGYLGVLKHGVPGFLAEGYFHTYMPSKQRAMNWDADRMEGVEFARGIANYFGLPLETTGDIYGVVRDKFNKFSHTFYVPLASTTDAMLPLNGVTVVLYDENDTEVGRYLTDNHYNGVYVFQNVKPGNYTIKVEKDGYQMLNTEDYNIVVSAATTTYSETWMADNTYVQPDITYYDYEDPMADINHVGVAGSYNLEQKYANRTIDDFGVDGGMPTRTIVRNGYVYNAICMSPDGKSEATPVVTVAEAKTAAAVRNVNLEGLSNIGDIALTADNVLVLSANGNLYRWKNDPIGLPSALPRLIPNKSGIELPAAMPSIAYSGTFDDGTVYATSGGNLYVLTITNGEITAAHAEDASDILSLEYGSQLTISPLHDKALIATTIESEKGLIEFQPVGQSGAKPAVIATTPTTGPLYGIGQSFFKMAGGTFMVTPLRMTGMSAGIGMYDITEGLDKLREVEVSNTWVGDWTTFATVNGQCYVNYDSRSGAFKSYYFDLYATSSDRKFTRISTEDVEQVRELAHYAYDLNSTGEGDVTISFKSTGAAPEANIVLTNVDNPDDVVSAPLGAVVAGDNTFTYNTAELPEGKTYNWGVEIRSRAIPESGRVWAAFPSGKTPNNSGKSTTPREGLVVFTDPAYPTYGLSIMSLGYNQGLWVYGPDHELIGTYAADAPGLDATNHSSLFRGTVRGDKAVWADWSDKGAGYWQFDPLNPEAGLTNILAGTNDGTGAHIYNDKNIGGNASGIAFFGEGDDEVLWAFAQDTPTPKTSNNLIRYKSAGKSIIDMEPDQVWNSANPWADTPALFKNANAEVLPTERGIFVTQIRTSNKNTAEAPSFILFGYDGRQILNSANIENFVAGGSGIAISRDYNTLYASENGKGIAVIELTWSDDATTVTSARKLYSISTKGTEHYQMALDPAGNLAVVSRGPGLEVYTLRNDHPRAFTPAATLLSTAGVEQIADDIDLSRFPVEYFDLQGRRVDTPAPGAIVIRRQGPKVDKLIVR